MKLPVPNKQDTTVILETYGKNEIPFHFADVKITINGPDVVVKTSDGHTYTFPFAAQLATMGKHVFTLVFADGKEIASDQLLGYATGVSAAPNAAAPQAHHEGDGNGTAGHDAPKPVVKEVIKEVTKEVVKEDLIVADSSSQDGGAGAEQADAAHKPLPVVNAADFAKHRFDDAPLPQVSHIAGMPPKPDSQPHDDPTPPQPEPTPTPEPEPMPQPEPTPAPDPAPQPDPTPQPVPTPPSLQDVVLLQTVGRADQSAHEYYLGAGSDIARNDARISTQYSAREVDLSHETTGWTIHADTTVGAGTANSMVRIVSAGSASTILDVTIDPALAAKGVSVVQWNSPEGAELGLKENEFALRYPTTKGAVDDTFKVHLDYMDAASGQSVAADIAFAITDAPTTLHDQNDTYQLSRQDNDVVIHGGAGDDIIIAGHSNGVYDGGGGVNTLDYSDFSSALVVDLSADVRTALGISPVGDGSGIDMGRVKAGDATHSIENIQIIKGGDGDNTFIGNQFDHEFIGGAGNNTFVANGGNNVYTGGGNGLNTIDYSRAGGTTFETVTLGASGRQFVLNGVDVDMANGVTVNNGWLDANGDAGADHFSGMNQIIGTRYNDRIKAGDGDVTIVGGAGDDLIIAGAGNDKIDGGQGFNVVSYAGLTGRVDVDLNGPTGLASKSNGAVDTLTHIQAVIGSAGGGTLTGLVNGNNLLIGTDGETSFSTTAGTNQLYGGAGKNNFDVIQGTNAIYGGATLNTVNAQGGINTFFAGDGVNVFNADGGKNVYHGGAGSDTMSAINGGNNTMIGGSGHSVFSATGGGTNTIDSGTGDMTVYCGGANNTVNGGGGGKTTVDYSGYQGSGHLDITLDRNLALIGNDFVDRLYDVDVIVGASGGNNVIRGAGDRGIEIHVTGDNNWLVGGRGNNVLDGGSGINNTVDYSGVTGAVNVNLNAGVATKNGYGFTDTITNIQRIVGSNASGNVFEGRDWTNDWIDVGTGTANRVVASVGNDTYVSHSTTNTVDYSKLHAGIVLNTSTAIVQKGVNGTDILVGGFGNFIGTDYGDTVVVSANITFKGGAGNDKFLLNGTPFAGVIDGGGGFNELDTTKATGGKAMAYVLDPDGRGLTVQGVNTVDWTTGSIASGATGYTTFKNIDVIGTSAGMNNVINWGTASHVTINGSTNVDYFFVNGGGNHIDGHYYGSGESIASQSSSRASIAYNKTNTGLVADFDAGVVSFADGRDSDAISNFSRFQGGSGNDVIKGHANQSDWISASGGNDLIDAGGGTSNVYAILNGWYKVHADFQTGTIVKYNSVGVLQGTDTVMNFQQYSGGNYDGDWVHGKDGVDMTFWMGSAGTKTLVASNANNYIDGGSSTTTIDYSGMTSIITVNLSGKQVLKGGGGGTDTYSNIAKILGTAGDDIFTFNTQADVTGLSLQGGGGNDTLQKSGSSASTYDLTTMLAKVTNIQKIDFSTSTAADKITIDFANLLVRGNETLTLNTGAKDIVTMTHNTAADGWAHTTATSNGHTTDTYTLGGHQLVWNH